VLAVSVVLSVAVSGWAIRRSGGGAGASHGSPAVARPEWVRPTLPEALDGSVFAGGSGQGPRPIGELAKRFRLAGTFFVISDSGEESRRAVVDDSKDRSQKVLAEGDAIGDVSMVRIYQDHVVLRRLGAEEELWLNFSRGERTVADTNSAARVAAAVGPTDRSGRFGGRKVGENRWVFSRDSLMAYYRTLTDNPERLVTVFDSLKPVYESGRINGYRLGLEGERDFFDAVGLVEGDVVLKANSLEMTNRRRAEFLIQQFVDGKSNAYVLDVNRDGRDVRLTYEIR
jgi:type II secretion system protein C